MMQAAATTDSLVVVEGVAELRGALAQARVAGRRIGFVPTMGALHDGHRRLLDEARDRCDFVVASCYVNPTQFAPGEDLDRYPRSPEHDEAIVRAAGTDVLWRPSDQDMYGSDPDDATSVRVGSIGSVLEGTSRPGHFDGVASIVVRLLGAVRPDELVLGRKDYQQVAVLRRVIDDFMIDTRVHVVATARESDGLALSSRNAYLTAAQRLSARAIPSALAAAVRAFANGQGNRAALVAACTDVLRAAPDIAIDYVELVGSGTLDSTVDEVAADDVLLVAVRVGETRLIDNVVVGRPDPELAA